MDLKGKVVLITGSTDGLGKLLAKNLSDLGVKVIVHGKNKDKVEEAIKELKAFDGIVCDFNGPQTIKSIFSKIEKLDILINNAGVWLEGNTIDASPEKILEVINVDLAAHILVTRTLLPTLLKSEFGQILNTISVAGYEIPAGYFHTIYSAAKFGMQGFSEALAKEFDNKNLRVMGYYPGGMETELFKKAGNDYVKHEPWMFNPQESVEAIMFMITRSEKVNIKRLDLINHLQK